MSVTPEPVRYTVKILFLRHSESCANMIKKFEEGVTKPPFRRVFSTIDPALTHRGEAMARDRGTRLVEDVRTFLGAIGEITPLEGESGVFKTGDGTRLIVGASGLWRAQQTAGFVLQGANLPPRVGQIHLLPYVSELGFGTDNQRGPQQEIMIEEESNRFVNLIDQTPLINTPGGDVPSAGNFFRWLGEYGFRMESNEEKPQSFLKRESPNLRMVIVTHSHWLKKLVGREYDNLDGAVIEVVYGSDRKIYSGPTVLHAFVPSGISQDVLAIEACPDNCPGGSICSVNAKVKNASGMTLNSLSGICTRLEKATTLDAGGLKNLAKDLFIMEKYRSTGVRPEIADAVKNLQKYGGGMFGGRSRENIAADVLPVQMAYGCGAGGGFCQDLLELYKQAEEGHNVTPDNMQKLLRKIELQGDAATKAAAAVLKGYRTRTGLFSGPTRNVRNQISDLKKIHTVAGCHDLLPKDSTCELLNNLYYGDPTNENIMEILPKITNVANQKELEAYIRGRGWFKRNLNRTTNRRFHRSIRRIRENMKCEGTPGNININGYIRSVQQSSPSSKLVNAYGGARRLTRKNKAKRLTRRNRRR